MKNFNRHGDVAVATGNLPHWRQEGTTYFVTFRLSDSLPEQKLRPWRAARERWLGEHPRPWTELITREYEETFGRSIQRWLDAGSGSCLLREPQSRTILCETLAYGHASRYRLGDFVIAGNHVHALVEPSVSSPLAGLVHAWKSVSAHRIKRGPIWQKESYDHIVRDEADLARIQRYIRRHVAS